MSRDTLTFRYNLWLPLLSLFCIKISSDWFFLNSKHALGVLLSDESSSEGGLGDQSEGDVQSVQVHSIPCHGESGKVNNWPETKICRKSENLCHSLVTRYGVSLQQGQFWLCSRGGDKVERMFSKDKNQYVSLWQIRFDAFTRKNNLQRDWWNDKNCGQEWRWQNKLFRISGKNGNW